MAEISPSILAADFANLGDHVRQAEDGGARMLHVDIMDGHFVPNISIGVPVVQSLSDATSLPLDCHLMITDPGAYIEAFVNAGASMLTVHQEACPHLGREIGLIRQMGASPGVAVNPGTPLTSISEVLEDVDIVLVMSVHPGFGGQDFIPSSLRKVRELARLRRQRSLAFKIQIDGGVNARNAQQIGAAGCDILVAGSSVFGKDDIAGAVKTLTQMANEPLPRYA